jgi:hypothetical protein
MNFLKKIWPYLLLLTITFVYFVYLLNDSRYFFYDDFTGFTFVAPRTFVEIIKDSLFSRDVDRHKITGYLVTKLIYNLADLKVDVYFFSLFLLHTINSFLLFGLLKKLSKNPLISLFLASVFAWRFYLWWFSNVHMMLAGLSMFFTIHLWLNYLETKNNQHLFLIWLIFPLMTYSYGPTVLLPPALFLLTVFLKKKKQKLLPQVKPLVPLVLISFAYLLFYAGTEANQIRFADPQNPYFRPLSISTYLTTSSIYLKDISAGLIPQSVWLTVCIWVAGLLAIYKYKPKLILIALCFPITLLANSFFPKHTMFYYLYTPIVFVFILFSYLLQSKRWWIAFIVSLALFNPFHNLYQVAFRLKHPSKNLDKKSMELIIEGTEKAIKEGKNSFYISNWYVTPNLRHGIREALPLFLSHQKKNCFSYSHSKETEILTLYPKGNCIESSK